MPLARAHSATWYTSSNHAAFQVGSVGERSHMAILNPDTTVVSVVREALAAWPTAVLRGKDGGRVWCHVFLVVDDDDELYASPVQGPINAELPPMTDHTTIFPCVWLKTLGPDGFRV